MNADGVRAWGTRELAKMTAQRDRDFYMGVLAAADGQFHEERCKSAGTVWESDYCEGGREGLHRLREGTTRATRINHGDTV